MNSNKINFIYNVAICLLDLHIIVSKLLCDWPFADSWVKTTVLLYFYEELHEKKLLHTMVKIYNVLAKDFHNIISQAQSLTM